MSLTDAGCGVQQQHVQQQQQQQHLLHMCSSNIDSCTMQCACIGICRSGCNRAAVAEAAYVQHACGSVSSSTYSDSSSSCRLCAAAVIVVQGVLCSSCSLTKAGCGVHAQGAAAKTYVKQQQHRH